MSFRNWLRGLDGKPPVSEDNEHNFWDDAKSLGPQSDTLPDGRKLKSEAWFENEYTFLTYTFPMAGLENLTKEQIIKYLFSQGINIDLDKYPLDKIELLSRGKHYQLTITIGRSDE